MKETLKKALAYTPTKEQLFSDTWTYTEIENPHAELLNAEPNPLWVKEMDIDGKVWRYIPIDKIEIMLLRIFKIYFIEVLRESVVPSLGVSVTVRVKVWDSLIEDWRWHEGVAGWPCEKKKDLKYALQMAKTFAEKDACDHFGKVFGRDLNRDTIYLEVGKVVDKWMDLRAEYEAKKESIPVEEQANIERILGYPTTKADKENAVFGKPEETSYEKLKINLSKITLNEN